jgi:hypothetical protein
MQKRLTPVKAIRTKCLDCMNGSAHEVKLCNISDCSLFAYRFGKNPARKGVKNKAFLSKNSELRRGKTNDL